MANALERDFLPAEIIRALVDGGVDFVVIGGVAVVVQAMPRLTKDIDICYSTEQANLDALGQVLVSLQARLRGVDEQIPFVPDGRTLRRTQIVCLRTPRGDIDLLSNPEGAPEYQELKDHASEMELAGRRVLVASIEDLLAMKRAAGRPQDLTDIESLEAALEQMRD